MSVIHTRIQRFLNYEIMGNIVKIAPNIDISSSGNSMNFYGTQVPLSGISCVSEGRNTIHKVANLFATIGIGFLLLSFILKINEIILFSAIFMVLYVITYALNSASYVVKISLNSGKILTSSHMSYENSNKIINKIRELL